MQLSKKTYAMLLKQKSPTSPLFKNMIWAFAVGGLICTVGQAISNLWAFIGLPADACAAATSITLVALGALLTGAGLYDKLAKYAGAGTIVPITGFANSIVAPAMEFKSEGFILGLAAKMFAIAGPVLVYGVAASVLYGMILFVARLL